jgi:hypothetical protein
VDIGFALPEPQLPAGSHEFGRIRRALQLDAAAVEFDACLLEERLGGIDMTARPIAGRSKSSGFKATTISRFGQPAFAEQGFRRGGPAAEADIGCLRVGAIARRINMPAQPARHLGIEDIASLGESVESVRVENF